MIARTLKDILTVKLKTRHDGYADQFNRIFMTKILLMASIIMCVEYFSDSVNCMVPGNAAHSKEFYQAACWITGFYIFKEMEERTDKSGYYGMPQRVDFDGINRHTDKLCLTKDFMAGNSDCVPMTKEYYMQYQWLHVYVAALGIFFYLPYIAFRVVNADLINLKKQVKGNKNQEKKKTRIIIKTYFNHAVNSVSFLRIRIAWNLFVKVLYVLSSVCAFFITDYFLQGKYFLYGMDYIEWSNQNITFQYTILREKARARSGNILLPSMGFCDVHEASVDIRNTFHNKNRYICEISPHVLYQYVLAVLWFFFVASCGVAVLGFFSYCCTSIYYLGLCLKDSPKRKVYMTLTLREIEYLEYVREQDLAQYGDLLRELKGEFQNPDVLKELETYIMQLPL